jgi:hypothetical protein
MKRIAVALVCLLILAEISLSFAWPHVVPRVGAFPRPASESWYDGCNSHTRKYERAGPVWGWSEDRTDRGCPQGDVPLP